MSEQRLKIAYLCDFSPLDRMMYSGGNAHMYRALQRHAGEVTILSSGWGMAEPARRAISQLPDAMQMRLRWRAHLALAPVIARKLRAELSAARYDVLFGTYSFHSLHRLTPPAPLVTAFSSDATQTIYRASEIGAQYRSKYPGGRALDAWVARCEAAVFGRTDLLFWPSQWLKDAADARYGWRRKTRFWCRGARASRPCRSSASRRSGAACRCGWCWSGATGSTRAARSPSTR